MPHSNVINCLPIIFLMFLDEMRPLHIQWTNYPPLTNSTADPNIETYNDTTWTVRGFSMFHWLLYNQVKQTIPRQEKRKFRSEKVVECRSLKPCRLSGSSFETWKQTVMHDCNSFKVVTSGICANVSGAFWKLHSTARTGNVFSALSSNRVTMSTSSTVRTFLFKIYSCPALTPQKGIVSRVSESFLYTTHSVRIVRILPKKFSMALNKHRKDKQLSNKHRDDK
jgi:hypothetical protein